QPVDLPELLLAGIEAYQLGAQPLSRRGSAQVVLLPLNWREKLGEHLVPMFLDFSKRLGVQGVSRRSLVEQTLSHALELLAQSQKPIPFVLRDEAKPPIILPVIHEIFIHLAFVV